MNKEEILKMDRGEISEAIRNLKSPGENYCNDCNYCTSCNYCNDCTSCTFCNYCYGCKGLKGKKYHILNVEFTKEEYETFIERIKGAK